MAETEINFDLDQKHYPEREYAEVCRLWDELKNAREAFEAAFLESDFGKTLNAMCVYRDHGGKHVRIYWSKAYGDRPTFNVRLDLPIAEKAKLNDSMMMPNEIVGLLLSDDEILSPAEKRALVYAVSRGRFGEPLPDEKQEQDSTHEA